MPTGTLKDIVKLSTGFKTAVNVQNDLDNLEKAGGYLPTEIGHRVIFDVAENLHPNAAHRARLIMGTYGTGKSHLALVLVNFYRRRHDDPRMKPLWDRLSAQWSGQAEKLRKELDRLTSDFLPVLLEGNEGGLNDALLRALKKALRSDERTADFLPDTVFTAAARRMQELEREYPDAYKALDKELAERGLGGAKAARQRLEDFDRSAYDVFREAHRAACAGADFVPEQMMRPGEVYEAVSRQLVREGMFDGIVVLWDEFGRYMEAIADDPRGGESRDIEQFAEKCHVPDNRLHLYLICHRSLEEYAQIIRLRRGAGDDKQLAEDMRKATGRFTPFHMRSSEEEIFWLIDQVVIQATDGGTWRQLVKDHEGDFTRLAEAAVHFRLFPTLDLEQVSRVVAYGAFPLHPVAAYCLPRLSEKVAQNERTLFTYLSESGSGTLGEFVARERIPGPGEPLPLATVADLWGYFEEQIESEDRTKRVHQLYQSALGKIPAGSTHAKPALKVIAVLEAIQTEQVKATGELLQYALHLSAAAVASFKDDLEALAAGDNRVLVRSVADGSYRFAYGGGEPLEDKVRKLAEERASLVSPITHLNAIWRELDLPAEIPATGYSDDRHVPRRLVIQAVGPSELKNLSRWIQNLGDGDFVDGYALLVIAEDTAQLEEAARLARGVEHPQIVVGIPRQTLPRCLGDLRRHEALLYLGQTEAHLYGVGSDWHEEWEASLAEYRAVLQQALEPLVKGQAGRLDSVSWLWRGEEQEGVTSVSRLTAFSSKVMETVFGLTPPIPHDVLADEGQKDTFRKHRVPVIDLLFDDDGPDRLAKHSVKPQKHVIDALLGRNGILKKVGGRYGVSRPDDDHYPAMTAVWDEVATFLERCRHAPQALQELVVTLRRPPYGLPVRCVPVIFAAVARDLVALGNLVVEHQRTKSLKERLARVNGEVIETAFAAPGQYLIEYLDVSQYQRVLLQGFAQGMGFQWPDRSETGQILETLARATKEWWIGLPRHAQLTAQVSEDSVLQQNALVVKRDIFEPLAHPECDTHKVLLEDMPRMVRAEGDERTDITSDEVAQVFRDIKQWFERAVDRLTDRAAGAIVTTFAPEGEQRVSASDALREWYQGLDKVKQTYKLGGDAGKLMAAAANPGDDVAERLGRELMGMPLLGWADEVLSQFRVRLESAKGHVEAFELPLTSPEVPQHPLLTPPNHARVIIITDDGKYERVFAVARESSDNGRLLENMLHSAVTGMGSHLPDGECLTIILRILREVLDAH